MFVQLHKGVRRIHQKTNNNNKNIQYLSKTRATTRILFARYHSKESQLKSTIENAKSEVYKISQNLPQDQQLQISVLIKSFEELYSISQASRANPLSTEEKDQIIKAQQTQLKLIEELRQKTDAHRKRLIQFRKKVQMLVMLILLIGIILLTPLAYSTFQETSSKQPPQNFIGAWVLYEEEEGQREGQHDDDFLAKIKDKNNDNNNINDNNNDNSINNEKKIVRQVEFAEDGKAIVLSKSSFRRLKGKEDDKRIRDKDSVIVNVVPGDNPNECMLQIYQFKNFHLKLLPQTQRQEQVLKQLQEQDNQLKQLNDNVREETLLIRGKLQELKEFRESEEGGKLSEQQQQQQQQQLLQLLDKQDEVRQVLEEVATKRILIMKEQQLLAMPQYRLEINGKVYRPLKFHNKNVDVQ